MKDKLVEKHHFAFNNHDNSGEQLTLLTELYDNGDETNNIYLNQFLTLQSYCNSATFNLHGAFLRPDNLRMLADLLEELINKNTR